MASVLMHLAMAGVLMEENHFADADAFRFGCLLPDAPHPKEVGRAPHFPASQGEKRTYDVAAFREQYGQSLGEEGLYLGYYLHLLQDIVYRRCQYHLWGWGQLEEARKRALYRDYSLLNACLIQRYALKEDLRPPVGIEDEPVCRRFGLRPQGLMDELHGYFCQGRCQGEPELFTWEMARQYMDLALDLCRKELRALSAGCPPLDPWELAWELQ